MRTRTALMLLLMMFAVAALAFAGGASGTRFQKVDIYLDAGASALGAYQLEFKCTRGSVKIAGIEGGEHSAFKEAPYYDAKAMQQERVVIAAFSTDANLPRGRTRVATIHLAVDGAQEPEYSVKLEVAADASGGKLRAETAFEKKP